MVISSLAAAASTTGLHRAGSGRPSVAHEGNMTPGEALQVLQVTERRPRWLLAQVHPDKHPERQSEATQATARVTQAMDVRTRHETEV